MGSHGYHWNQNEIHRNKLLSNVRENQFGLYYNTNNDLVIIKEDETGNQYTQRIYLSKIRKYAKKQTNHKIRHMKHEEISNYAAYRRVFDYAYELD